MKSKLMAIKLKVSSSGMLFGNVSRLAKASAVSQIANLASIFPVAHLLGLSQYGHYVVVLSVGSLLGSVAFLRLDAAIIGTSHEEERIQVWRAGLTTASLLAFLTSLSGIILPLKGSMRVELSEIAIVMFASALFAASTQFLLVRGEVAVVAKRTVWIATLTSALQVVVALADWVTGLSLTWAGVRILVTVAICHRAGFPLKLMTCRQTLGVLRRYQEFPKFSTPATLANVASFSLIAPILSAWFGSSIAGAFGLANQIAVVPTSLLGAAASQAITARVTHELRSHGLLSELRRLAGVLGMLAGVYAVAVLAIGWSLGPLLMSRAWESTVDFLPPLLTCSIAMVMCSPVHVLWIATGNVKLNSRWNLLRLAVVSSSLIILHKMSVGAQLFVWGFACITVSLYIMSWIECMRLLREAQSESGHSSGTDIASAC